MSNPDLRAALEAVRDTLRRENDKPGGPIVDTIWHTPHETLFDFIDGALKTEAAAMAATVPAPDYWARRDGMKAMSDDEKQGWIESGNHDIANDYCIPLYLSCRTCRGYGEVGHAPDDYYPCPDCTPSQAPVADQPAEPSPADLWYLQDTRSYVGNDVLWWAREGAGYTADVSKAHVFTRDEAFRQAAMRGCDRAWPKAYIDGKTRPAVDMQHIDHEAALEFAPKGDSNG